MYADTGIDSIAERDSNLRLIILDLRNRSCSSRPTPNTGQCRVTSCAVHCCMTSDLTCSHEWLTVTPSTHTCASIICTPWNAWSGASVLGLLRRQSGRRFKGTKCLYFRGGSISLQRWGHGQCSSETLVLPTRLHGTIKPHRLTNLHYQTSDPTWGQYITDKFIPLNQLTNFDTCHYRTWLFLYHTLSENHRYLYCKIFRKTMWRNAVQNKCGPMYRTRR